jgi:acyl carrier protein
MLRVRKSDIDLQHRRKGEQMATVPTHTIETEAIPDLDADILTALAAIRCVAVADLEAERAAAGGQLEMDSPEAVAVIAKLEARYGRRLARVEDLEPEQLTSTEALTDLLRPRLIALVGSAPRSGDS